MKLLLLSCVWAPLAFSFVQRFSPHPPVATGCHDGNVTYSGVYASENEVFFGIKYGQNTGGENRFKPPVPYVPPKNSVIEAVSPGFACPQEQEPPAIFPISEDCLALNVWRPNGTKAGDDLPVLVYIYGGMSNDNFNSQSRGVHRLLISRDQAVSILDGKMTHCNCLAEC